MTAMYISKRRLIYQYSNEFHFVGQISKRKNPFRNERAHVYMHLSGYCMSWFTLFSISRKKCLAANLRHDLPLKRSFPVDLPPASSYTDVKIRPMVISVGFTVL